jgi:hypothetical protein
VILNGSKKNNLVLEAMLSPPRQLVTIKDKEVRNFD